jgi:hypothetical protein
VLVNDSKRKLPCANICSGNGAFFENTNHSLEMGIYDECKDDDDSDNGTKDDDTNEPNDDELPMKRKVVLCYAAALDGLGRALEASALLERHLCWAWECIE